MAEILALVAATPPTLIMTVQLTPELAAEVPRLHPERTTFEANVVHAVARFRVERVVFESNGEIVDQVPITAPNSGPV